MKELIGTGVALATPMNEDYSVDYPALEKLINHTIEGGVDYLVVLGTTGESPVFSWSEKLEILSFVFEKNNGRRPIVFGLGGNNTLDLISKSKDLQDFNLAAILSASPYYNKPSQEGIFMHYTMLADAFPHPIILYNVPSRTASNVESETTLKLANHKNIIAMKEASGDLSQCESISRNLPEGFMLLSGDDALALDIIEMGGSGVISVAANIIPQPFTGMIQKALKGENGAAKQVNIELEEAYNLLSLEGNPSSLKAGLEVLNIGSRTVKPPLFKASDEMVRKWKDYFRS